MASKTKTKRLTKAQLRRDVEFFHAWTSDWVGNQHPDERDEFQEGCNDARDRLLRAITILRPDDL